MTLTFYDNPIKRAWKIQRQNLPALANYEFDNKKSSTIDDLSFIFKNPTQKAISTHSINKNRICQEKLIKKLQ